MTRTEKLEKYRAYQRAWSRKRRAQLKEQNPEKYQQELARARAWKAANREKVRKYRATYRKEHGEQERQTNQQWIAAHPDRIKEHHAAYRNRHREKLNLWHRQPFAMQRKNERSRKRYRTDRGYAIEISLRGALGQALRLGKAGKKASIRNLLGISIPEFVEYITAQFHLGMTWDRRAEWHLDHIRPCASFDLTMIEEQQVCFHYTNFQPLWAADNRAKNAKWGGKNFNQPRTAKIDRQHLPLVLGTGG